MIGGLGRLGFRLQEFRILTTRTKLKETYQVPPSTKDLYQWKSAFRDLEYEGKISIAFLIGFPNLFPVYPLLRGISGPFSYLTAVKPSVNRRHSPVNLVLFCVLTITFLVTGCTFFFFETLMASILREVHLIFFSWSPFLYLFTELTLFSRFFASPFDPMRRPLIALLLYSFSSLYSQ